MDREDLLNRRVPVGRFTIAFGAMLVVVSAAGVNPAQAAQLTLRPSAATAIVGTDHTLTAKVSGDDGSPTSGVKVRFLFPDCEGTSRLVTDSSGEATCVFTRTFPGTHYIGASADLNGDSSFSPGEPSDEATVEWVAGPAVSLTLDPASQVRLTNSEECVTAAPRDATGTSSEGILIRFVVSGANPTVGSARTSFFDARFCYTGRLPGEDRITAYVDQDEDGVDDDSEPSASATKLWLTQRAVLTVSPLQSSAAVGTDQTLDVSVKTADGAPLGAVTVRFSSFDRIFDGCSNYLNELTTDAAGAVHCTFTSDEPGPVNIQVRPDVDSDGGTYAIARHRWVSGDATTMRLFPSFAVWRVGKQKCLSLHADDAAGRPAADKLVRIAITGTNPSTRSVLTSDFGGAFVCYTGTAAGEGQISAYVDNNENGIDDGASEPGATATRLWVSQPPVLTVTPASGSALRGMEHTLTATLTTAAGAPIAGIPVGFRDEVPSANYVFCNDFSTSRSTDAQGRATCTYKGRKSGTDNIGVWANLDNDFSSFGTDPAVASATFTWLADGADTLTMDPDKLYGLTGSTRCMRAAAYLHPDDLGPVEVVDKPVRFTVTGANPTSATVRTNYFGSAEFCYTPVAAGDDVISAFADNNENGVDDGAAEPQAASTARWLTEAPSISLSPASSTGLTGSRHTVTAKVTGSGGLAVAGAPVVFYDDGGPNFDFCDTYPTPPTDSDGYVTCSYTGEDAGTDTIRAFVDLNPNGYNDTNEPRATATRTWTAQPAESLSITPAHAVGLTGRYSFECVTAHPTRADGRGANHVPVVFTVTGPNPQTATRTATYSDGPRFCYEGVTAGEDAIAAFADNDGDGVRDPGEPEASAEILWLDGQPDTVALDPPTAVNPVGTVHRATVTVSHEGRPLPGMQIVFNVSGANRIRSHVEQTDEDGRATLDYQAAVAGTDTITAIVDTDENEYQGGDERTATAMSIWTTEPPTSVTLAPQSAAGPFGSTHCVDAVVRDQLGRSQANRVVRFAVSGANADGGFAETAVTGTATFCYTSVLPGTDTITAYADTDRDGVKDSGEPQGGASRTVEGARLEVRKTLQPAGDPGRFALQIDGATVPGASAVGDGGSTGEIPVATGSHTVGEVSAVGPGLGAYMSAVTCRATDGSGAVVAEGRGAGPLSVSPAQGDDVVCTITNVRNRPPDCGAVTPTPASLWPPNGMLRWVRLSQATDPDGDAVTTAVTNVVQDEPLARERNGTLRADAVLPGGRDIQLRAERSGSGDGRVYRVRFKAMDSHGGVCTGAVPVTVPHSSNGRPAVDSAPPGYRSLPK